MPSRLYRRASSAGSPADLRPSKLTPLTTCPLRTSRQAMIRLDSIDEVAEDLQADVSRFFRVELHAGDVAPLDDRRE